MNRGFFLLALVCLLSYTTPTKGATKTVDLSTCGIVCNIFTFLTSNPLTTGDTLEITGGVTGSVYTVTLPLLAPVSLSSLSVISGGASVGLTVSTTITAESFVTSAGSTVTVTGQLIVDQVANASGAVIIATQAFVSGTLSTSANAVANFYGGLNVSAAGSVSLSAGSTVYIGANSVISGSLSLANNAVIYTNNSVVSIANLAVTEVNATVRAAGAGLVTIQDAVSVATGRTLNLVGSVVANSLVTVSGSLVAAGDASAQAYANLRFAAGVTIASSAQFTVSAYASAYVNAQATLSGTVTLANNAYLTLNAASATVGTLVVNGVNTTLYVTAATAATVSNNIEVAANNALTLAGNVTVSGAASVRGALAVGATAVVATADTVRFQAAVNVDASATLAVNAGTNVVFTSANTISGAVTLASNSAVTVSGGVTNFTTVTAVGATTFVVNAAAAVYVFGQVVLNSNINVQASSSITLSSSASGSGSSTSGTVSGGLTIDDSSSLTVSGGSTLVINLNSEVNGTVTLAANSFLNITAGVVRVKKSVVASGTTVVRTSLVFFDNTQTYTQQQGSLLLQAGVVTVSRVFIGVSGSASATFLGGSGGISGSLTIYASLSIGNSPGTVYVSGDCSFSATSTFNLEIASAASYDKLLCGGNVAHAGILSVSNLGGFTPTAVNTFDFITFNGTTSGSFATVSGSSSSQVTYNPKTTTLKGSVAATTTTSSPAPILTSSLLLSVLFLSLVLLGF